MAKSVRIWAKKQLRLEPLTIRQRQMVEIGSAGLLSVFQRVRNAQNASDAPAKPLTKRYAIYKSKRHLGNKRNLFLTGQMLRSLKLRTVRDNRAYASVGADMRVENKALRKKDKTIRKLTNKDVAWVNQQRDPWLLFSPANRRVIIAKAREVFNQAVQSMVRQTG